MRMLYLLGLLLVAHVSHAQKEVDSLLAVLPAQTDTAKTLTYADLCWLTGQSDLVRAQKWGQTGLALARRIGFPRGEFENLRNLGATHARRANYPTGLAYFLEALPIAEKLADSLALARVLKNIGMIYNLQKEYTRSLPYYDRVLKIYQRQGTRSQRADVLYSLAEVYLNVEQYSKSAVLLRQCMAIYKAEKQQRDYGLAVNAYAWALTRQDRYPEAIPFYHQSLTILTAEQDTYGIGNSQNGLAESYYETGDLRQAEQYGRLALATLKPTGIWNEIKQAEKHLFRIYTALGDPVKARQHFKAFEAAQDSVFGQQ